jgi:hypothetical protein
LVLKALTGLWCVSHHSNFLSHKENEARLFVRLLVY